MGSCSKNCRGADVQDHGDPVQLDLPGLRAHLDQQAGRQVVDHVPAEVLQAVRRRGPAGAGHARHHDQPQRLGRVLSRFGGHEPNYPASVSTSPVAMSIASPRGLASSASLIAAASLGPKPGTAAISSTLAARSFFSDPK